MHQQTLYHSNIIYATKKHFLSYFCLTNSISQIIRIVN